MAFPCHGSALKLKNVLLFLASIAVSILVAEAAVRYIDGYPMFAMPLGNPEGSATVDPAVLDRLDSELHSLARIANQRGRCKLSVERLSASTPAMMDEALLAALDRAAENRAPGKHIRMPSGAGHDAQWLARKLPAAMLFVPSGCNPDRRGRSCGARGNMSGSSPTPHIETRGAMVGHWAGSLCSTCAGSGGLAQGR